jgi:hypothetical protein
VIEDGEELTSIAYSSSSILSGADKLGKEERQGTFVTRERR